MGWYILLTFIQRDEWGNREQAWSEYEDEKLAHAAYARAIGSSVVYEVRLLTPNGQAMGWERGE